MFTSDAELQRDVSMLFKSNEEGFLTIRKVEKSVNVRFVTLDVSQWMSMYRIAKHAPFTAEVNQIHLLHLQKSIMSAVNAGVSLVLENRTYV